MAKCKLEIDRLMEDVNHLAGTMTDKEVNRHACYIHKDEGACENYEFALKELDRARTELKKGLKDLVECMEGD